MTQISEPKNLFEFDKADLDICELDKTACFFCPSENGGENSFSTQMTDEIKETSVPATPEQDDQPKPRVKTITLKRKILSEQKFPVNSIPDLTVKDRVVSDLRENLTQVIRSDTKPKFNHVKALPILTPITVSHRGRTAPLPAGKEQLTDSLEIKDFLNTETGLESENQNFHMDFQSSTAKAAFYKSRDHREGNNDWKVVQKDNFIIKKSARSRMPVRNLGGLKAQNPVISEQSHQRQTAAPHSTLLDKEVMNINTEGDLESTSHAICEYNLFKNARPFDSIRIANYTPNPQTTKYPTAMNHKKTVTFLIGNQDEKPTMRNIVTPKVLSTSSSGVVKFNILKKKESEQNLEPRPFSSIFGSELAAVQNTEGNSREAFYPSRMQKERPRSRFKNQEVVLSRLFNMKIQ